MVGSTAIEAPTSIATLARCATAWLLLWVSLGAAAGASSSCQPSVLEAASSLSSCSDFGLAVQSLATKRANDLLGSKGEPSSLTATRSLLFAWSARALALHAIIELPQGSPRGSPKLCLALLWLGGGGCAASGCAALPL